MVQKSQSVCVIKSWQITCWKCQNVTYSNCSIHSLGQVVEYTPQPQSVCLFHTQSFACSSASASRHCELSRVNNVQITLSFIFISVPAFPAIEIQCRLKPVQQTTVTVSDCQWLHGDRGLLVCAAWRWCVHAVETEDRWSLSKDNIKLIYCCSFMNPF